VRGFGLLALGPVESHHGTQILMSVSFFIVLDRVDKETDRLIRDIAWEVGFENERVITTIVMVSDQFERGPMSESTWVASILQEGVAA
jgi:hypothetical protein